jgi:hypothetical protein
MQPKPFHGAWSHTAFCRHDWPIYAQPSHPVVTPLKGGMHTHMVTLWGCLHESLALNARFVWCETALNPRLYTHVSYGLPLVNTTIRCV